MTAAGASNEGDLLVSIPRPRWPLKLPLEIFKSGIAFQGVKTPWEALEGCRSARYSPNTLVVCHHRLRHDLLVRRDHRAAVEAALRDIEKWQS